MHTRQGAPPGAAGGGARRASRRNWNIRGPACQGIPAFV